MLENKKLVMEQVDMLIDNAVEAKKLGGVDSREGREEAEAVVQQVVSLLGETEKIHGESYREVIAKGWQFVRMVNDMIESYNMQKTMVHCDVCHSSFIGGGPTTDDSIVDAKESLASHVARFHPRTIVAA